MTPRATEDNVSFILNGLADYLGMRVRREDVRAAWSGVRPLAVDPTASNTADAVREHVVVLEPDGLLTVAGKELCVWAGACVLDGCGFYIMRD